VSTTLQQPTALLVDISAPPPSVAPSSSAAVPVVSAVVATSAPAVPRPAAPKTAALLSASTSPAGDVAGVAQLRLTADPPATVTVVGAHVSQTHVTPVPGLKLPPGSYSVTFRSPTFGAPVVAQVELSAGGSRSVHADFRAAEPTVTVR
jgi:hypothetical protein